MSRKQLLMTFLLCCTVTSAVYSTNSRDPEIPDIIDIRVKGGSNGGTNGVNTGSNQTTVSAYYTSDTLTVEFASYAGIAVISIIDEVTGTAVSQTIGHITATANTVQTDISTLPDGNYTLSIVPQTGDEYEGEFTIQRE